MKKNVLIAAGMALLATAGCGEESPSSSNGVGGAGSGTGGAGGTTTSSTADGGAGGAGGSVGAGGEGGAGGGTPQLNCIDKSKFEAHFTIQVEGLCVVGSYVADHAQGYPNAPSWGRQGGPLTLQQGSNPSDEITLTRYVKPDGESGSMSGMVSPSLGLSISVDPLYMNAKALDIVNSDTTLVGYDVFGQSAGEVLLVNASSVVERHNVNGAYDYAMLGAQGELGRLLYTALTPMDAANDTPKAGLYAVDLCKGKTGFCGSETIHQGGDAAGPVTVDGKGNAFAVFPDVAKQTQAIRGFLSSKIGFKMPADPGAELASLAGTGSELAALAPQSESGKGYLLFQASDSSFTPQDPTILTYSTAGNTMTADTPKTGIELVAKGSGVHLMNDAAGRIWLGIGTDTAETTYFVIDHAPAN